MHSSLTFKPEVMITRTLAVSWFLRIVVNDALRAVRQQSRLVHPREVFEDEGEAMERILAENGLWFEQREFGSAHENAEVLKEILNNLSPEHRAVLQMKYYLDMSDEEIAETLDIPRGTVKSRLHKAKMNCRSLLERLDLLSVCG